jgi:hypothetical protein
MWETRIGGRMNKEQPQILRLLVRHGKLVAQDDSLYCDANF